MIKKGLLMFERSFELLFVGFLRFLSVCVHNLWNNLGLHSPAPFSSYSIRVLILILILILIVILGSPLALALVPHTQQQLDYTTTDFSSVIFRAILCSGGQVKPGIIQGLPNAPGIRLRPRVCVSSLYTLFKI